MSVRYKHMLLWLGCVSLFSCNSMPPKNHGPIVLGDSATIVTESDPRRLQDLVTDLTPIIPASTNTDTPKTPVAAQPQQDTAKKPVAATPPPPPAALPAGPGLKAEFKETSIMIPGINAKIAGNGNLEKANGAVYTLEETTFNGKTMKITGNVTKVSQRYQSIVILKTKNGMLPLDNLTETTSWEQVKGGGNGSYPITGLDENSLEYSDANGNAIRNAVMKACNKRHLSHKKMQEWLSALGNVKKANQKPLVVSLRSVMWKIDGKDAQGKIFSKQIRVDVPM